MRTVVSLFSAALAVAAAFVAYLPPAAAQPADPPALTGTELTATGSYRAGSAVKSTRLGIAFKVPAGTQLKYEPQINSFTLTPDGVARVGLLVLRTGMSTAEGKTTLGDAIDLTFLHQAAWGRRTSGPAVGGTNNDTVESRYQGDAFGRGRVLCKGDAAGVVLVIFDGSDAAAAAVCDEFQKSIVWAAPAPANGDDRQSWTKLVRHQTLANADYGLTINCRADGSYDMTGGGARTAGKWSVQLTPFGAVLHMATDSGEFGAAAMARNGDQLTLDGVAVSRTALPGDATPEPVPPTGDQPVKPETPSAADTADRGQTRKIEHDPAWKTDQKEVAKLDGEELRLGQAIQAGDSGKQLKTDYLGMSFRMPAGFAGICDGKTPVFAMRPADQRGLGLIIMQTGVNDAATMASEMTGNLDLSSVEPGVMLAPVGAPRIAGGVVTQDFRNATYVARTVGVVGPSGNAIGITFIGPVVDEAKVNGYVKAMVDSVQFIKPGAEARRETIRQQLSGKCLQVYRYRQAGSGANSSSWETKIRYHFGSDGTYAYTYHHEGSHSYQGRDSGGNETGRGGAGGQDDRKDAGRYRIEFNLTAIVLILTNDAGAETVHQLREVPGKLLLNGEEVSLMASDLKK